MSTEREELGCASGKHERAKYAMMEGVTYPFIQISSFSFVSISSFLTRFCTGYKDSYKATTTLSSSTLIFLHTDLFNYIHQTLFLERNTLQAMPGIITRFTGSRPSVPTPNSRLLLISSIPRPSDDRFSNWAARSRGAERGQDYYIMELIGAELREYLTRSAASIAQGQNGQHQQEGETVETFFRISTLGRANGPLEGFTIRFFDDPNEMLQYAGPGELTTIWDQLEPIAFAGTYVAEGGGPQLAICVSNDRSFTQQMCDTMKQTYRDNFSAEDTTRVESLVAQGKSASSELDAFLCAKAAVILSLGGDGQLLNSFELIHCDTFQKYGEFCSMTDSMMGDFSAEEGTIGLLR